MARRNSSKVSHDYSLPALWHEKAGAWHQAFPGARRRILASALTGMMAFYRIEPGSEVPLHSHPHAQFGIYLEGSGEFHVGKLVWKAKKGDGYYIPPGIKHSLKTSGKDASELIEFFTPVREEFLKEILLPDE